MVSSDFEGAPLSIHKYMDAGLATVATHVDGSPEILNSGEDGLLVPAGDPSALARAVGSLLADAERRGRMGRQARERRRRKFSVELTVERVSHLYDDLLSGDLTTSKYCPLRCRRARSTEPSPGEPAAKGH